jgi:hypothetical protein
MRARLLLFPLLFAWSIGCGGKVVVDSGGGGATGSGPSAATGSGPTTTSSGLTTTGCGPATTTTGAGGGSNGGCPVNEPVGGASCDLTAAPACSYGDTVRPECRDVWTCAGGVWSTAKTACAQFPPGVCGNMSQEGLTCTTQGAVCTYGDTICMCDDCAAGPCMAPPIWQCISPPAAPCPMIAPNEGSACSTEGAQCDYGFLCAGEGEQATCTNGLWVWTQNVACAG